MSKIALARKLSKECFGWIRQHFVVLCIMWRRLYENSVNLVSQSYQFVAIVFLTTEFCKRRSDLQQAYYYILYVSYITDLVSMISFIIEWTGVYEVPSFNIFFKITRWYCFKSPGIHEFMFALNRFTAMRYPTRYLKIWTGIPFYIIMTFMLTFPIVIDAYFLIANFHCQLHDDEPQCAEFGQYKIIVTLVINVSLVVAAFPLILFAFYKSSSRSFNSEMATVERKLLLYTGLSTILFILRFTFMFLTLTYGNYYLDLMWMFSYQAQHYIPLYLLPFINHVYRRAFVKFIRCKKKHNTRILFVATRIQ
uniref:G_PROTEIN_RECEP_F1_2 domain-containing protein n=1 Tax=Panagrellus redivivus TaxID=6233 RepID=A0A7E4VIF8_PANRE